MTRKQKLGVVSAVVGLLGIQAVFFSSPRLDPFFHSMGLCISIPMSAVLLFAVLLHIFRREKEIWISLPAFLLFLPIAYPWPMAIMMKVHEVEIRDYIESGSPGAEISARSGFSKPTPRDAALSRQTQTLARMGSG